MDRSTIAKSLIKLSNFCKIGKPNFEDPDVLGMWLDAFEGITREEVARGFGLYRDKGGYFPSINELRQACGLIENIEVQITKVAHNLMDHLTNGAGLSILATDVLQQLGGKNALHYIDITSPYSFKVIRDLVAGYFPDEPQRRSLAQPPAAVPALPPAQIDDKQRDLGSLEQRRELMREIKELANRLRFTPRQERDAG